MLQPHQHLLGTGAAAAAAAGGGFAPGAGGGARWLGLGVHLLHWGSGIAACRQVRWPLALPCCVTPAAVRSLHGLAAAV